MHRLLLKHTKIHYPASSIVKSCEMWISKGYYFGKQIYVAFLLCTGKNGKQYYRKNSEFRREKQN